MNAIPPKQNRIGVRVPHEVYLTLCRAAELSGATVNQFLIQAALKEAHAVIERGRVLQLSARDRDCLLDLMNNPPAPNPALQSALQHYQKSLQSDASASFDWQP